MRAQNRHFNLCNRPVNRWSEECQSGGLNVDVNTMFPGLVRLVSMVLLVSMAHLATTLNTLNDSGGSPRTTNTGSVWERSCCCLRGNKQQQRSERCLNGTTVLKEMFTCKKSLKVLHMWPIYQIWCSRIQFIPFHKQVTE